MRLVKEWKVCHKLWSIRLGVLGSALTSVLIAFPDTIMQIWSMLPMDIRDTIAPEYAPMIGVVIFASSMVARLVQQDKLTAEVNKTND